MNGVTQRRPALHGRSLRGPVTVAAAGLAAFAVLRVRDPHTPGAYLPCPFHAITGLWCPGCGGLRAANDLAHADLAASLSSNVFVAPLVLAAVLAWLCWVSGRTVRLPSGRATLAMVVVVLVAFTVVRNTGWGNWLAPA
ncbi:DUF2752 domain-containing protein [Aldersonia sp. NBC_00410]|uniref:DUF2752 domain-containing protein n=1 Tax=Aldersonia sp. NBC_00410 TaxID=2975954 RepID=UPI0022562BC6|nr:DUF2752 domain-containing protein [Aldersonia sp. NBC_00410]MCX5043187.1 DUF2752 domain-containing protein [Aldersonia sp. NBC_00410]